MIPIALPSASFYLLLTVSFFAGVLLFGWLLALASSAGMRRAVRLHWKKSAVLFVLLAVLFSYYAWFQAIVWQVERESERQEAARNVTLAQPTTVGGTDMPAGTRLKLQDEGQLETYLEAEFPQPVPVYGIQATQVRRFLGTDYDDDTYALIARYPRTVILRGAGDQAVQGWQCDATQDIEFDSERDGAMKALNQCQLGHDNHVGDMEIAPGSILYGSEGTVYVDGFKDPDRWRIEVKDPVAVKAFGLMLSNPRIYLDADRRLLRVSDTELACGVQWGDFRHAAGTQVKTVRRVQGAGREPFPGVIVFSPSNGQPAKRDGHDDVSKGMSVMQGLDGSFAGIVKNEEVGVFEFATFVVGEEEPEAPTRARCPAPAATGPR
jgi:hypothetical protein